MRRLSSGTRDWHDSRRERSEPERTTAERSTQSTHKEWVPSGIAKSLSAPGVAQVGRRKAQENGEVVQRKGREVQTGWGSAERGEGRSS